MITKRKYPWIAKQDWSNVLFLHWPVVPKLLQPFIPPALTLDTFANSAWVSIVVFQAENSRFRYLPKQFAFPPVTQINVRTYVKHWSSAERGVYFLNLHVKSVLAVIGAKTVYRLPFRYLHTEMAKKEGLIAVTGSLKTRPVLSVQYCPSIESIQNELAYFLTERYCIWNRKGNRIIKIPILHSRWDLQKVNVEVEHNELLSTFNQELLTSNPVVHYCTYKRAKLFPYEVNEFVDD